jgi:hypothetical protein
LNELGEDKNENGKKIEVVEGSMHVEIDRVTDFLDNQIDFNQLRKDAMQKVIMEEMLEIEEEKKKQNNNNNKKIVQINDTITVTVTPLTNIQENVNTTTHFALKKTLNTKTILKPISQH